MTYTDLIQVLRRMKVETGSLICLGCGHEHNCSTHGCAILREAAERIERLKEYEDAEEAGLLVRLPCGDDVSVTRHGEMYKGDHWNMPVLTAFCKADTPRGEKVGLFSIEEVQAALHEAKSELCAYKDTGLTTEAPKT